MIVAAREALVEATAAGPAPEAAVIAVAPEAPAPVAHAQEAADLRAASAAKVALGRVDAKDGRTTAVHSTAIVRPSLRWHRQTSGWSSFRSRAVRRASLVR